MEKEQGLLKLVRTLRAEQRQRWLKGDCVAAETYFDLNPKLLGEPESALELVYNEVLLREAAGEGPQLAEYVRRFPQFAGQLPRLFEVHRALESSQLCDATDVEPWWGAAASPREPEKPSPWPSIAGYELLGELGRGGMGVVYKARHLALNRIVALKMILTGCQTGPAHLARFRAEAEAVARLQHPNIVQVHDVGEQDGRPYFSLEFVNGGNLAQRVNGTPQPARAAAKLIHTLSQAIHTAHQQGIIHRDLKPANILFQGLGTGDHGLGREETATGASSPVPDCQCLIPDPQSLIPKITDFGLAKQMDVAGAQTGSGTILGTASYMAPEQAEGKQHEIGPAADVYALGAILYELLAGRPPFKAETQVDTLRLVLSEEPISLSRLHLKVPRDLETICLKCLQKDSRKRYASAQALAEDLERFLSDQPIHARRTAPLERAWRWTRRNPALAALMTSIGALLLFIALGALLAAHRFSQERNTALDNLARAVEAERNALQAREATEEQLWEAKLEQARASRQSNEAGRRFRTLKVLAEAAKIRPDLRLRNEAIACLALADMGNDRPLGGAEPTSYGFGLDPLRDHYARSDSRGGLSVRRVADEQEVIPLAGPGYPAFEVRFSPDGRYLAAKYYLGAADLAKEYRVWDWRRGQMVVHQLSNALGTAVDFSPDSRSVVLGGRQDGTISFYELPSGKEVRCLRLGYVSNDLSFNPAGDRFAASELLVRIHDVETGEVLSTFGDPVWKGFHGLAWNGDGRLLAAACTNANVYLWNTVTGLQHAELKGHEREVIQVAFSRRGGLLASSSWDGTTRLWDTASGKPLVRALGSGVDFGADDGQLSYQSESQIGIREVANGDECRRLQENDFGSGGGIQSVDFSPNGRILAASSAAGVRLWDAVAGKEIANLPIGPSYSAFFHPRGDALITSGARGLVRWPLSPPLQKATGRYQIGLPQAIDVLASRSLQQCCLDQDGRLVAVLDRGANQATVVNWDKPDNKVLLSNHRNLSRLSLSPKGTWAATGTWKGSGVRIWDAASGKLIKELAAGNAGVAFSPDGDWLVVGEGNNYRFYRTESWQPAQVIRTENMAGLTSDPVFAPDSRMLAVWHAFRSVKLFHPATGRELATLMVADPQNIVAMRFSPDGSQLAVATIGHVVQLWDLRDIRRQLQALNLDWDAPACAPAETGKDAALVQVDVCDNALFHAARGEQHLQKKEYAKAIAEFRAALAMEANDTQLCNTLAWIYVAGPVELRDPKQALTLIQRAVDRQPKNSNYQNTFGTVLYRLGNYQRAVEILKPNAEHSSAAYPVFDWIVLAMSYQALGQASQARACYERAGQARRIANLSPGQLEELNVLWAEADTLLRNEPKL
jgi:serine/threonine protein kinase/WD40 repeat protein